MCKGFFADQTTHRFSPIFVATRPINKPKEGPQSNKFNPHFFFLLGLPHYKSFLQIGGGFFFDKRNWIVKSDSYS